MRGRNYAKAPHWTFRIASRPANDIHFSHDDDTATPPAGTLGAYQGLIEAGKVRVIGASNNSGARGGGAGSVSPARAARVPVIAAGVASLQQLEVVVAAVHLTLRGADFRELDAASARIAEDGLAQTLNPW